MKIQNENKRRTNKNFKQIKRFVFENCCIYCCIDCSLHSPVYCIAGRYWKLRPFKNVVGSCVSYRNFGRNYLPEKLLHPWIACNRRILCCSFVTNFLRPNFHRPNFAQPFSAWIGNVEHNGIYSGCGRDIFGQYDIQTNQKEEIWKVAYISK